MTLDKLEIARIEDVVITNIRICYDREQEALVQLGRRSKTEGEIRAAAGNLVEHLLQNIIDTLNQEIQEARIESKVGSTDFLTKEIEYKGKIFTFDQIQVDRHVWANGRRIAFIENKTYLDSCYYDRALADFRKIAQSLNQHGVDPVECQYIVFVGQNAASGKTLLTYEADFWNDVKHLTKAPEGITPKVFFFLKGKRSSQLPLYKIRHELNEPTIRAFTRLMISLL